MHVAGRAPPPGRGREIKQQGQQDKGNAEGVGNPRYPGHSLGIDGVKGKEHGGQKSGPGRGDQPPTEEIDQLDGEEMEQKFEETKAEGIGPPDLVDGQIGQVLERAIVVTYPGPFLREFKGPGRAGEDPPDKSRVLDIGVIDNLGDVVVDKGPRKYIEVGGNNRRRQEQSRHHPLPPADVRGIPGRVFVER